MNNIYETIDVHFASKNLIRMTEKLSIEDLEKASSPIIQKAVDEIMNALGKASLQPSDIDLVILAGGSSQLPGVRECIKEQLGIEPCSIPRNLMMAVSYGAALYQREIFNLPKDQLDKKMLGDSIGIYVNTNGKVDLKILLAGNTVLPAKEEFTFPVDENNNIVTISLVSQSGKKIKNLNKRDLKLSRSAKLIKIVLSVDENKLVQLTAYDPKRPDCVLKMNCDVVSLSSEQIRETQDVLNIKIKEIDPNAYNSQQCVGIDLGTTTSELTYCNRAAEAELKALENPDFKIFKDKDYSKNCFPSVIFFKNGFDDIQIANGAALSALEQKNCFSCFKVANHFVPLSSSDGKIAMIDGKKIMVRDLSALLLNKIWETACNDLPIPPCSAVITVPASYDADECEDTYNAAKIAGIENVVLIDEPTAAIYYYAHIQGIDTQSVRNVLVFDFGGGTTDIAILDIKSNSNKNTNKFKACQFDVLATSGNTQCGGRDIDAALYKMIVNRFLSKHMGDSINIAKKSEIKKAIENAKISLSEQYYI